MLVSWLLFLSVPLTLIAQIIEDHYATLGVQLNATLAEIKRAYRAKALIHHPDKLRQTGVEAAEDQFRRLREAYEVLTDVAARHELDENAPSRQQQPSRGRATWFAKDFKPPMDKRPLGVRKSQERVIKVSSLSHLRSLVENEHGRLEYGMLLALHDARGSDCMEKLVTQLRYPFPFAGWSDGAMPGGGMWWEDVMQTFAASYELDHELKTFFRVQTCPSIIFAKKGSSLRDHESLPPHLIEGGRFTEWNTWMDDRLQTAITIRNNRNLHVQIYFGFGQKSFEFSVLAPGQEVVTATTISHEWIAVDAKHDGNGVSASNSQRFVVMGWHNQEFDIFDACIDSENKCNL